MKDDIIKILEYAIWAPSGDNSQPWRFEVSDNKIWIFNVPERDTSIYNFKQRASFIAHGCLIENTIIAASEFGYKTEIKLFPNAQNETLVAEIILTKNNGEKRSPLFQYIKQRVSNRKPYEIKQFTSEHKAELQKEINSASDIAINLHFTDDRKNIKDLARLISVNEKIVLENEKLHHFLFNHITWSEKEDAIKKDFLLKL